MVTSSSLSTVSQLSSFGRPQMNLTFVLQNEEDWNIYFLYAAQFEKELNDG